MAVLQSSYFTRIGGGSIWPVGHGSPAPVSVSVGQVRLCGQQSLHLSGWQRETLLSYRCYDVVMVHGDSARLAAQWGRCHSCGDGEKTT